jgi:hypothetical protein
MGNLIERIFTSIVERSNLSLRRTPAMEAGYRRSGVECAGTLGGGLIRLGRFPLWPRPPSPVRPASGRFKYNGRAGAP